MSDSLNIVIFGLSVTSSWGNGHATTYRGLMRGLHARGHRTMFLERNSSWYAENRDLPRLPYGTIHLYSDLSRMKSRFKREVMDADLVIVGSYVPDGRDIGEWVTQTAHGVTAFYDIDTPVTLSNLNRGAGDYISTGLIRRYDLYLSFTGGPMLHRIERQYGARRAHPLYCSVDPSVYYPENLPFRWDLGYMGTYSEDRQPLVEELLLAPARRWREGRMIIAGAQYPANTSWPANVEHVAHLPPDRHREFYCSQRFTLNVTRAAMREAGFSPSVRLFEAAACRTAIISDAWPGLETIFRPGRDILLSRSARDTLEYLRDFPERQRQSVATRARERVLKEHTAAHRALELEMLVRDVAGGSPEREKKPAAATQLSAVKIAGPVGN